MRPAGSPDGTAIPGRAYAHYFAFNMGCERPRASARDVIVQTIDGYRFAIDLNGMDPFGFIFYANNEGFIDCAGKPTYQSVQLVGPQPGPDAALPGAAGGVYPRARPTRTTRRAAGTSPTSSSSTRRTADLPPDAPIAGGGSDLAAGPPEDTPGTITNLALTGGRGHARPARRGAGRPLHLHRQRGTAPPS